MKRDRYFYAAVAAVFLVLIVIGFRHYIFEGRYFDGTPIGPVMLATVIVHSSALFAWFLLFFVQSLLISVKNRGLHMKLGWSVLVIASTIAVTGPFVAVRATRVEDQAVFDWPSRSFLLIMFSEIALYVVFVAIGVINRKRPRIHRPMMLLASLSLISGATARIPLVNSIFGFHQWMALFGPVAALGVLFLLTKLILTHRLDREYAVGFAAFVAVSLIVSRMAMTNLWVSLAETVLKH